MKVIDARSGKEMRIGDVVNYPDGEWIRLISVDEGILSATAVIDTSEIAYPPGDGRKLVRRTKKIPLGVRYLHPSYMFQKIAFIPS